MINHMISYETYRLKDKSAQKYTNCGYKLSIARGRDRLAVQ